MTRLAVGTSQLRSVRGGLSHADAVRFIRACADAGVQDFDTANIYGQGDAERVLGEVTKVVPNLCITTKVGLPMPSIAGSGVGSRLKPMAAAASRSKVARKLIGKIRERQQEAASVLSLADLESSLEGSLGRLRARCVDRLMLHNPPPVESADGQAWSRFLAASLTAGRCRVAGVSHAEPEVAIGWASESHVTTLQIPGGLECLEVLRDIRAATNVTLVVRQVFSGGRIFDPSWRRATSSVQVAGGVTPHLDYVSYLAAEALADEILIGSTKPAHIQEILDILRGR